MAEQDQPGSEVKFRGMREGKKQVGEFASSLVLILIGVVYLVYGSRYPWERLANPGPGFFPAVIGAIFLAGSAVLCVSSFFHSRKEPGNTSAGAHSQPDAGSRKLWLLLALLAVYLLTVEPIGYLINSFLLMFFSARLMGARGLGRTLLLAVGMTLGTYLLFGVWLQVPLPKGIWGGS